MCLKTNGFDVAICLLILSFIAPMNVWYTVEIKGQSLKATRTNYPLTIILWRSLTTMCMLLC